MFAHEAGHIASSRHLFYSVLFAMASVERLCSLAGGLAVERLHWSPAAGQAASMSLLLATWGVLFGFIGRRSNAKATSSALGLGSSRAGPPAASLRSAPCSLRRLAARGGPERHPAATAEVAARLDRQPRRLRFSPPRFQGGTRNGIDRVVRRIKVGLWLAAGAAVALWTLRARTCC